ncbi:MAG: dihydroorotase [Candidatus Omnitrophica bacterium]|nr:dihydroorotase [Candidatus Omnitrophota bacterium]
MALLIKNARIVNAAGEDKETKDILIDGGKIVQIAPQIDREGATVVDAKGKKVLPGFIDLHVHLREPGREDKETIESGSRSAVKGGFTSIFCMPNTTPAIDTAQTVQYILDQARKVGLVNVYPVGAITKNRAGVEITEMMDLKRAGCLGVSDDGRGLMNSGLMRRALEYAKMAGLLVMQHCEDDNLSAKGMMNEGALSTLLGLKGDPFIAETVIIARDIEIARYLGTRVHFMHISSARSVDLIRRARAEGVKVTCEATPHHFTLTEEVVKSFDTSTKVNPPLRTRADVDAIKAGLKDGTIDCIATDHAPHTHEDKEVEYDGAPPGLIGLETAFALALKELVAGGVLTLPQLVDKMSASPARVMGLENKGDIAVGKDADLAIVDLGCEWKVTKEDTVSKSKNSPFMGWALKGRVTTTVCGGKLVYTDARAS